MKKSALSYVMAGATLMALLVLAVAASVALSPASAATSAADAGPTADGRLGATESPAAAFQRMLAARAPVVGATAVPPRVDPLLPYFNTALWSAPATRQPDTAARIHTVGSRR